MKERTKQIFTWILIIIITLYIINVTYKRTFNPYADIGEELAWDELQPADIILIQERWIIGWIPGFWSHTVIFDSYDQNGTGWVIESKYDGIRKKPLKEVLEYWGREKIILRLKNTTPEIQSKIMNEVYSHLGKNFSYLWLGKEQNPDKFLYCSELIWKAYKDAGYDLDVNPGWVWPYFNSVAPQEIYDSPLTNKYYTIE